MLGRGPAGKGSPTALTPLNASYKLEPGRRFSCVSLNQDGIELHPRKVRGLRM